MSTQYPIRRVSWAKSATCRSTDSRQRALNSAMPKRSMSGLPANPSSCSTAISTVGPGNPSRPAPGRAGAAPAGPPRDVPALHRLEAGEDVLEGPGLDVVGARPAVGGGRPLVEDPLRLAGGGLQGPGEDLVGLPPLQDLLFEGGQFDLRGQRGEGAGGTHAPILPEGANGLTAASWPLMPASPATP